MQLTVDDDTSRALDAAHAVGCNEAVLALIFGEDSRDSQCRSFAVEVLSVVGRFVMQNLPVLLPEDIRLWCSLDVALQCNCVSITAT